MRDSNRTADRMSATRRIKRQHCKRLVMGLIAMWHEPARATARLCTVRDHMCSKYEPAAVDVV
jgi:hypothetical protein